MSTARAEGHSDHAPFHFIRFWPPLSRSPFTLAQTRGEIWKGLTKEGGSVNSSELTVQFLRFFFSFFHSKAADRSLVSACKKRALGQKYFLVEAVVVQDDSATYIAVCFILLEQQYFGSFKIFHDTLLTDFCDGKYGVSRSRRCSASERRSIKSVN